MKFYTFILLFLFCGCSNPNQDLLDQIKANEQNESAPDFISIEAFELLGSMNEPIDGELKFSFSKIEENDNITAYRDQNSSLVMTTMGEEGKYSLIEIIMPLKDFMSEKKSDEGAVRFCHGARRMAKAIDQGMEAMVEKLVNDNIEKAISTKDGAFAAYKGMIIKFNCNTLGQVKFVNFVVGVPD